MRNSSVFFACSSIIALATGCDPGSVDGGNTDELLCSAEMNITGSFAIGDPKPAEITGCWAVGTWTFSMVVGATNDCSPAPVPLPQYQLKIERDLASEDPDYTLLYTYLTDPNDMTVEMSVSGDGGGLCEADLVIYADAGKTVWNLHPSLQADNSINGLGDYEKHTLNQIPQSGP